MKRLVICVLLIIILSSTAFLSISASAAGDIQSITLDVTNTSYNTYAASWPTVEITLNIILAESYTGGGYIELPLSRPTAVTHPGLYYGTDGTDGTSYGDNMPAFFVGGVHSAGNMVKSIAASGDPDVLVITLKDAGDVDFATGLTTIILRFEFNPVWRGKVPADTLMWSVAPVAYISGVEAGRPAPVSISRDSGYGGASVTVAEADYLDYTAGVVSGGIVVDSASAGGSNRYLYFDPGYAFTAWLEIPTGSVLSAGAATIWGAPVGVVGGYDRYEAYVTHGQGSINRSFTPPASIVVGETFEVRGGITGYRYVNSDPSVSGVTAPTVTYTKISPAAAPEWVLSIPLYDAPGAICYPVPGAVAAIYQQTSSTAANSHIINSGTCSVTGVWLDFYQNSAAGSQKVNFNEVTISAVRSDTAYPWSYYKADCELIDAFTGVAANITLGTWPASGAGIDSSITLPLPALDANQYINKIIVTPMGDDGLAANVLPAGNGFGLSWRAKAWDSGVWPDGSGIPGYSAALLGWKFFYDDNPLAPGDYPITGGVPVESREFRAALYYSQAPAPGVAVVSSPPMFNVTAGDILDVTILGSNYFDALSQPGQWVNPRIMLRVPYFMVLVSGTGNSGMGSLTAGGSMDTPFIVQPELTYSDAEFNYYSFQAAGYSAPPTLTSGSYAFNIPASFEITSAAYAGSYTIYSVVSQLDAESFVMNGSLYDSMDNLPAGGAGMAAYGLGAGDHYYLSGYNALTVPVMTAMSGVSAIKNEWTDDLYVSAAVVPAKPESPAVLCLSLTNTGNVNLDNIRLYDIIPREGDMLGSSGSLELDSITASQGAPSVYYASPSAVLPTYGAHGLDDPNLQDTAFWYDGGWSTTAQGANTMAILIDFSSSLALGPGESVNIELLVQAPADIGVTAYNQYRYSARRQDDILSQYNFNGSIAGVSTSAIIIEYNENLPDSVASTVVPGNMPSGISSYYNATPAEDRFSSGVLDSLQISSESPTLSDFTFTGWNTTRGGDGETWAPGSWKQFGGAGMLMLFAQWEPNAAVDPADPDPEPPDDEEEETDLPEPEPEEDEDDEPPVILPLIDEGDDEDVPPAPISDVDDGGDGSAPVPPATGTQDAPRLPENRGEDNSALSSGGVPTGWMDGEDDPDEPPITDMFTVLFVDWDGALLTAQLVERGENAIPPSEPVRVGYSFIGWDLGFTDVQSDLVITAMYDILPVFESVPESVTGIRFVVPDSREMFEVLPWKSSGITLWDDDVPRMSFGTINIPVFSRDMNEYVWALVNLILGTIGAILAAVTIFRAITRKIRAQYDMKYTYTEPEEQKKKRQRNSWIISTITLGVVGVVVFMITQDMRRTMVLLDYWSIAHSVIIVLEIVASLLSFRRNKVRYIDDSDLTVLDVGFAATRN